jgi:hypothetical protein
MNITKFVELSLGKWRSQRSAHHLAFSYFEQVISTIDFEPLELDDPQVISLCKSYKIAPQLANVPFKMSWEGESDWDENEVVKGSTILVPIPDPQEPSKGKLLREQGYAETILGRKRYYKDINSKNNNLRTAAERAAINMPIQGTASDMMKIAMINIDAEMQKRHFRSMMTIQVHDELVFEVYKDELSELKEIINDKMIHSLSLGEVPVIVDIGIGNNWFEAH